MILPESRFLKDAARRRLNGAGEIRKIILIYVGILTAVSAVTTVAQFGLGKGISQTGGLQNIGMRSILNTVNTCLPIVQFVILTCLSLGFMAVMLRTARGQYTSAKTLKVGVERFWVLLRCTVLQGLIYAAIGFGSSYLAAFVFMLSPFGTVATERLMPLLSTENLLGPAGLNPAMEDAVMEALTPVLPVYLLIFLALFLAVSLPLMYRYRMVDYLLIDRPGIGALEAMRESGCLMRGNRFRLFRLDLSFWWYYLLSALVAVICYGDLVMQILGIPMPFSADVGYFLFYGVYLAANFAVFYFFAAQVECTYAAAYDSLVPKQPPQQGAVLGNIFQM